MNKIDLTGNKYGRLTVIEELIERTKGGKILWNCQCECGSFINVTSCDLKRSHTVSCGCHKSQSITERSVKHNLSNTDTFNIWCTLLQRCNNPNNRLYKYYGGRGITVCEKWTTFEGFYEDMGKRPKGLSIDRIDNNKGYFKENCRWATIEQQSNNRRTNISFEYNGENRNIREWENTMGFRKGLITNRLKRGWPFEKALNTKVITK
jgi:hypothetical protein